MLEARRENRLTYKRLAQRIRVPAGFVIAPLLLIVARPSINTLLIGAIVAVAGLATRAWASGYLMKNQELTTTGPYAHTRNPLYLGTLLLGTGIAISSGTWWFVAIFMAIYLFIYYPVMLAEADTMRDLFSEEYEHYRRHVPMLVPRLTAYVKPLKKKVKEPDKASRKRYDRARYMHHREYRAALGALIIYGLLIAKMLLIK